MDPFFWGISQLAMLDSADLRGQLWMGRLAMRFFLGTHEIGGFNMF